MLEVELVALGIHFENCGNLHSPAPGLLVFLGIYVELAQEVLDITLVLSYHKARLEVLIEGQLRVAVSLSWCLIAYPPYC